MTSLSRHHETTRYDMHKYERVRVCVCVYKERERESEWERIYEMNAKAAVQRLEDLQSQRGRRRDAGVLVAC